jgi:hypothetical protein
MSISLFKNKTFGRAKLMIYDADTDALVREFPWQENLVFDVGLNTLAGGIGMGELFSNCTIGNDTTTPNSWNSGAVTFTQAGTAIVASAGFFTPAMTGCVFKYGAGSGGQEMTITYVSSTAATASISYTQATPTGATVWNTVLTGLLSPLYLFASFVTSGSSCGTTYAGNVATMQRTFKFSTQASPYLLAEIGYGNSNSLVTCKGRFFVATPPTISPSQYPVIQMQMVFTVSPGVQTAVTNVGTGIDTSGTAIFAVWDCVAVDSSGSSVQTNSGRWMDGSGTSGGGTVIALVDGAPALATTIAVAPYISAGYTGPIYIGPGWSTLSNAGQPLGVGETHKAYSFSTTGTTVVAIVTGAFANFGFQQNLTTPFVTPVGTMSGTVSITITFARELVN